MMMAAGLGTRARPFTEVLPKPLLPLLGVPVAQFGMDLLAEAGVTRVVANVHHLADRAIEGLKTLDGPTVCISDERARLLGSAGGMRAALPQLGPEPFFWINADVLCDVSLRSLAARHQVLRRRYGVSLTLTVFRQSPPGERYAEILLDPSGDRVASIGQKQERCPFFASVAVVEPEALLHLPPGEPRDFLTDVLLPAIAAGKVGAYVSQGDWYDLGSPSLWLETHLALQAGLETGRISHRWRRRIESSSYRLAPGIWVGHGSRLEARCAQWAGPCYWSALGDDCAVMPASLGPRAVVYGTAAGMSDASDGIGYQGLWVSS